MKKHCILALAAMLSSFAFAQTDPAISSWIINTTGATGFNNIPSNVQQVQYSTGNVYVSCTSVPGYTIGPWTNNPNTPTNQNFVFKITRQPQQNTGNLINTPLGHIGIWSNGVSIYNAKDGMSFNNQNIWQQNAIVVEGPSFDNCLGHPAGNGEYHHHLNPTCLYNDTDSLNHSPIIGYAFDGFPVYGAYGYASTNGTGGITRMRSSYKIRNVTDRTTLPNGTTLTAAQHGPVVSATRPLGYYLQDFEFISGLGDLDIHNGRFSITPEYPQGTYAYFVTLNSDLSAAYPYVLGSAYYGTVQAGNTGPGSGHVTITEPVTTFLVSGTEDTQQPVEVEIYPNPATTAVTVYLKPGYHNNLTATLCSTTGQVLHSQPYLQPSVAYSFVVQHLPAGVYLLKLEGETASSVRKIVVLK